jgi:hypothetical protein
VFDPQQVTVLSFRSAQPLGAVADNPDIDPQRFRAHTIGAMRRAFPNAEIRPGPDDGTAIVGVHPGDHHVVALR